MKTLSKILWQRSLERRPKLYVICSYLLISLARSGAGDSSTSPNSPRISSSHGLVLRRRRKDTRRRSTTLSPSCRRKGHRNAWASCW
uniref:Uncharacterized protein n=1 Tax=Oryza brachyantha TaxID=4533 RepID=J3L7S7_ORYBR